MFGFYLAFLFQISASGMRCISEQLVRKSPLLREDKSSANTDTILQFVLQLLKRWNMTQLVRVGLEFICFLMWSCSP